MEGCEENWILNIYTKLPVRELKKSIFGLWICKTYYSTEQYFKIALEYETAQSFLASHTRREKKMLIGFMMANINVARHLSCCWSSSAEHPRERSDAFWVERVENERSEAQNPVTRSPRKSTSAYTL